MCQTGHGRVRSPEPLGTDREFKRKKRKPSLSGKGAGKGEDQQCLGKEILTQWPSLPTAAPPGQADPFPPYEANWISVLLSHHTHPPISRKRWGPSPGRPTLHLWELPLGTPHLALLSDQHPGSPIAPAHQGPACSSYRAKPLGRPTLYLPPTLQHSFISRLHSLARIPELQNLMEHSRVSSSPE